MGSIAFRAAPGGSSGAVAAAAGTAGGALTGVCAAEVPSSPLVKGTAASLADERGPAIAGAIN